MYRSALLGVVFVVGCSPDDDGRSNAWQPSGEEGEGSGVDVDPHDSTSGGGEGDEKGESSGGACTPGESGECVCDGLHLGTQSCSPEGVWEECECNEDPSAGSSGGVEESGSAESGGEETTGETPGEVCYPGADMAFTTCFPVTYPNSPPDGYEYPPP